ncbi:MAG: GMC family oxidoreductase N-terminal domain-containing protein [Burkholderiales bacterium]
MPAPGPADTFDYVIVGAGSAGCVLANRLTANGRHSVLLLEAGGSDRRFFVQMPIGYGKCFHDARVNWRYRTEPEASLAGRAGYWPRGKVLGGSSAINAMVFVRGQPQDFDGWAALGNAGWAWCDVLPYFRRMEDCARGASEWRGAGGPFATRFIDDEAHPLCGAFLRAGEEAGFRRNEDFNGATQEGVGYYEIAVRDGRRVSSASAYLDPARSRSNLAIVTDALVTRLGFEGARAASVTYERGEATQTVRAAREVIVCAGAVASPALLQCSGVGPAPLLQSLGIPVIRDAPAVGHHLQDHLCIDYLYRAKVPSLNEVLRPWHGKLRVGLRYLARREGPLAMSVNQAGGFVRSRTDVDRPDLQLYFSPLSYTRTPPGVRPLMTPDPFPGFLLSAQPCRPRSRGRIEAQSTDPRVPPRIVPGSLSDPADLADLVAGARLLRRLASMPALASIIAEEMRPSAAVGDDDDALAADIRARASSVFHPTSTCRMGVDPRESVVDPRLRVHGIAGLRVVDASVFPSVTSGNTNAPVLMVAERAADVVLADVH